MQPDYPAAHSMDATWFAVDSRGRVGVFFTGENGHLPRTEETDVREEIWELYRPADMTTDDGWDGDNLCNHAGLYVFDFSDAWDEVAGFYVVTQTPAAPLHVDQLPPSIRLRCTELFFDEAFDEMEGVQPLQIARCYFWGEGNVAYLCSDGATLKPIPGKEAHFARFVAEFRRQYADEAEDLVFDGPLDPADEKGGPPCAS
jgi:hypothetical protein